MFGKPKNQMETGITLIANNCEITGDICFSDELWITEVVKGNVIARRDTKAK
ncbi:MAG: polymer-forming cytoskeletal protein, partial [Pseudomonadales bacterium]|nr:polymer-forming cytoskeletal protein [Pseudomonadales bacterium]